MGKGGDFLYICGRQDRILVSLASLLLGQRAR